MLRLLKLKRNFNWKLTLDISKLQTGIMLVSYADVSPKSHMIHICLVPARKPKNKSEWLSHMFDSR